MNISKDVIRDLLPVYVSGEACADTRALVEQNLGVDGDLRAEAEALGTIPVADIAPPAALEFSSLKRTQCLLAAGSCWLDSVICSRPCRWL
jgi:hypothetical protein